MKTHVKVFGFAKWPWAILAIGLALAASPPSLFADLHLDMLKTRTDTFTNVTVYNRTTSEIFIRHQGGIANIKLVNLPPETVAQLDHGGALPVAVIDGMEPEPPSAEESAPTADTTRAKLEAKMREQMAAGMAAFKMVSAKVNRTLVAIILGTFIVFYLFNCYCLHLICQKTGNQPGILIWIPLLQMFPLFRAAGMSAWWFLGLFLPIINLVTPIMWCFKIVRARGKSVWVAIGLLLPLTNFIALLYLAFSDGASDESGDRKVSIGAQPLGSEA